MEIQWISALLGAICVGIVTSEFNDGVCSVIQNSCGLVPPPLPTNFEARGEHVDYLQRYATYEETYFDFTNSRGKYMYVLKGIEHHFLFDYEVQQVVAYDVLHPGVDIKKDPLSHTCTATNMDDSEYRDIFGFLEDTTGGRPKMYNSNQAMRYGGQYQYAFNGTERMTNRGLWVDKFIGCLYDDSISASVDAAYFFTSKTNFGVGTSAGTLEKTVTGIENGLLSVPVKGDFFGTVYDEDSETQKSFNKTMSYYWFNGEPEFKAGTFQLPPFMYCSNYRGRKDMPKFPVAFDTRLQRTTLKRDIFGKLAASEVTSFETVYYYKEKNLARKDYTPDPNDSDKEIYSKFENYSPVKTIYDFNIGLLYVTNIPSGRCYIRPIGHGDYFQTTEDTIYISMATPEQIFQMERDEMEYKGKDFTRDIECDIWAGKYYDKALNATYAKETFISTNGWHEEVDELLEYGVPVKHTVIQKELDGELMEGFTAYNFLKFMAKPPELQFFDVSNCIETQNYKDYAIFLTISDATKQLLFDYKTQFLETVQYYISDVAQVLTPLRVQRLHYRQVSVSDTRPLILFTLVDKIELKNKILFGQKGADLDEAAANLYNFIEKNQFAIKFYSPNSKEMTLVPGLQGSLYVKTSDGNLNYFAPVRRNVHSSSSKVTTSGRLNESPSKLMHADPSNLDEENEKGMSPGALSLLALSMLFIGIGIGIAVMYLYLRQKSEAQVEDKINLATHSSMEMPTSSSTHNDI